MRRVGTVITGMMICMGGVGAEAGSISVQGAAGPLGMAVVSFKEARFRTIYKQAYDFSCGSAALASLLTFHYDFPVTEKEVFDSMYQNGDLQKIRMQGFSLLDMKQYLQRKGYDADGYRLSLTALSKKVSVPAIALINTAGYNHFVIIKGVHSNEVVVGDPAKGVRVITRNEFEKIWNGIAFLIKNHARKGRATFDQAVDWRVHAKAPFGTALTQQSLSRYTMTMPGPDVF